MHVLLAIIVYVLSVRPVFAEYVLPYPSYMPGNKLYTISRLIDRVKEPLYFGNISSYKYHLGLADKYIVEAKILFEYKQYLLATDALKRSNNEFARVPVYLILAKAEGKDVSKFTFGLSEAASLHKQLITRFMEIVPQTFTWTPEKSDAIDLPLYSLFRESVMVRENAVISIQ